METQNLMKTRIGTKETEALKPAVVKIVSVRIQEKTKEGKEMSTPLVHLECKHPDREELISLSKAKFEKNGKLEVVGLWAQTDEEGLFKKSSAVSVVLRFLKCASLEEVYTKEIETVKQSEDINYLCLKAY